MKLTILPSGALRKQEFLDVEVCDAIGDLIAFGAEKDFFDCSCQTSEGKRVQVEKGYIGSGSNEQEFFRVRVWTARNEDGHTPLVIDVTVQKYDLPYVLSLRGQMAEVRSKRKDLDAQDSHLAREELDLEQHVVAAVMALCLGTED